MKISKKIPITGNIRNKGKFDKIPLDKMQIGDSIKLCNYTTNTAQNLQSIYRVGIMSQIVKKGIKGSFKVGRYMSKELRVWKISN